MPDKLLSSDAAAGVLLSNDESAGTVTPAAKPSLVPAITTAAAAAISGARAVAEEVATNPKAWKVGKAIGETVGFTMGAAQLDPLKAAGGMWVGGKAGWRLTNAAQRLAVPLYTALKAAEPFAAPIQALSGEADALQRLNSPEGFAQLARAMNPPARQRLLDHFKDQPEYVAAIKKVTGMK